MNTVYTDTCWRQIICTGSDAEDRMFCCILICSKLYLDGRRDTGLFLIGCNARFERMGTFFLYFRLNLRIFCVWTVSPWLWLMSWSLQYCWLLLIAQPFSWLDTDHFWVFWVFSLFSFTLFCWRGEEIVTSCRYLVLGEIWSLNHWDLAPKTGPGQAFTFSLN